MAKRISKYIILHALGSILVFASWVLQNNFQKSFQDQREQLDRLRHRISTNEILANTWFCNFKSYMGHKEINPPTAATMALAYINFSHQVRATAARWTNTTDSQPMQLSTSYLEAANNAQRSNNSLLIVGLVEKVHTLDQFLATNLTTEMESRYVKIKNKEDNYGKAFNATYMLGACLIGLAFIWKHSDKSENSTLCQVNRAGNIESEPA